jgi:pyruvyltransferase
MKKKKINLKWARHDNDEIRNFGDDLAPYIINKLSGICINHVYFVGPRFGVIKQFLSGIKRGKLSLTYVINFIESFFTKGYVISIGSIIQWYGSPRCTVWGSGIINKIDKINQSNFLAVRGEYTKAMIKKLGFKEPSVVGDPALLLPLLYTPVVIKKYRLGIIPHQICSCEYTISTSLHGLIVSHAYNIKSLWFSYGEVPLYGDDVKFLDYFSSVGIAEYKPFILSLNKKIDSNEIINTILNFDDVSKINVDIKMIQKRLIDVAPFPVKPEFCVY